MLRHAEELFEQGDANHDGMLSSDELQQLLLLVGLSSPPQTSLFLAPLRACQPFGLHT